MTEINIASILHDHGLRLTKFRSDLLALFYQVNSSLTAEEIKNRAGASKDKVTIYRALDAFEKTGLIHRVPDKSNLTRYALCQTTCDEHGHEHNHAHFICGTCNETFCIDDIKLPEIKNTNGFRIKSSKLTLEGDCPDCSASDNKAQSSHQAND